MAFFAMAYHELAVTRWLYIILQCRLGSIVQMGYAARLVHLSWGIVEIGKLNTKSMLQGRHKQQLTS